MNMNSGYPSPQQSDESINLKEERNYRIITAIFGILTFFIGIIMVSVGTYSFLFIRSLLMSMGIASLFNTLLGGLSKEELLELKSEDIHLSIITKLAANIKISGPIVTFVLLTGGIYFAQLHNRDSDNKQITQIQTILQNTNLKYIDRDENIDGLFLDRDEVHRRIQLIYQPEGQVEPIVANKSLTNVGETWKRLFFDRDLELNFREINQPEEIEKINFDIKDGTNRRIHLGFLEQREITQALKDLALPNLGCKTVRN